MVKHSGFPEGAKWEARTCNGDKTIVWLRERTEPRLQARWSRYRVHEAWHWSTSAYTAGAWSQDLAPSRAGAFQEARQYAYCEKCKKQHRFKRVLLPAPPKPSEDK